MIKMFTPCYSDFRPKYSDIYHSPPFNQARSSLFFRSFLGAIIQFSVAINKKAIQQICTKNDDIWERDDLRICLFLYARVRKFCSAFNSPNPCQFFFFFIFPHARNSYGWSVSRFSICSTLSTGESVYGMALLWKAWMYHDKWNIINHSCTVGHSFVSVILVAVTQLCKRLCPSVSPSVRSWNWKMENLAI